MLEIRKIVKMEIKKVPTPLKNHKLPIILLVFHSKQQMRVLR